MDDTYRFLRQVEHRLQILFDRQTHEMPRDHGGAADPGDPDGLRPAGAWEDRDRPGPAVPGRLPEQDRAEPADPQPPPPRRLPATTTAPRPTPWSTWCSTPTPAEEHIAEVLGRYPFRDRADRLSQPDGPGPRGLPVPLAGALPPLPRGDRPAAAPGRRPDRRPRHDARRTSRRSRPRWAPRRSSGSCSTSIRPACGSTSSSARPASSSRRS